MVFFIFIIKAQSTFLKPLEEIINIIVVKSVLRTSAQCEVNLSSNSNFNRNLLQFTTQKKYLIAIIWFSSHNLFSSALMECFHGLQQNQHYPSIANTLTIKIQYPFSVIQMELLSLRIKYQGALKSDCFTEVALQERSHCHFEMFSM